MKIFIISSCGDSLDLAEKLSKEEHEVSFYVRDRDIKVASDTVNITRNPSHILKSDLNIVEDTKSGSFVERAKKSGKAVIGGGTVLDRIATDSKFGTEVLLGCGLKLAKPETQGTLLEVGGWFTNKEFIKPYFLGFKYTKFGAGDVGPELGPMGIVGMYKLKGRIFRETLRPLETILKSMNYVGYVGLDILVNNNIHVVGWQPGLAFPTVNILSKLHNNFGNFLNKVALGTAKVTAIQPDKVGIGITWLKLPWLYDTPIKYRPQIVCETGGNIDEARSNILKTIRKTLDPNDYYRTDLGSHSKDELKRLITDGWL